MRKYALLVAVILLLSFSVQVMAQEHSFIQVKGNSFKDRLERATAEARARSNQTRFWTAYTFEVRAGYAYRAGAHEVNAGGSYSGRVPPGSAAETTNIGVFTLHEPDGVVVRVTLHNLDRTNDYGKLPVLWLGRAETGDSLGYLQSLLESSAANAASENAVQAVAMHSDPQASKVLMRLISNSSASNIRLKAVQWLSMIGDSQPFFLELVQNERENLDVRKQAVFALGLWGQNAPALADLERVYKVISNREVKERILLIARMDESENAQQFLVEVASSDSDAVTRKRAILYLSQKSGPKSFDALRDALNRPDASAEIQRAALMAISQRPRDEAVPFLIDVAKRHPNQELRNQAVFWLQRSDDTRAKEFLKPSH